MTAMAVAAYVLAAFFWFVGWLVEWDLEKRGEPAERKRAARMVLLTPVWPLPAAVAGWRLIRELLEDAR